jgi:hypothetical protein
MSFFHPVKMGFPVNSSGIPGLDAKTQIMIFDHIEIFHLFFYDRAYKDTTIHFRIKQQGNLQINFNIGEHRSYQGACLCSPAIQAVQTSVIFRKAPGSRSAPFSVISTIGKPKAFWIQ